MLSFNRLAIIPALGLLATLVMGTVTRAATVLEPGFTVFPVVGGLDQPTVLAFAPDGRLFVGEKGGTIRVVKDGVLQGTLFARLEVWDFFESGLLGLTLDPDFETNGFVYVFATVAADEQHIIRLRDDNGVGVDATVIKNHIPSTGTFHNGGCMRIGPDNLLYFSVGDNGFRENSQDITTLAGKINRIRLDGTTPDTNPFTTITGSPRTVFALGFRNPFRFCIAPDGRLFVMDVGSDNRERQEELNVIRAGDNGGWPVVEGIANPPVEGFVQPAFAYHDQGASPTGVVFYDSPTGFPAEYRGTLFHLDYTLNRLFRVRFDGDKVINHDLFMQGEGAPVDLAMGPDGSLYYCELIGGRIMRIVYGDPPTAVPDIPPAFCGLNLPPLFVVTLMVIPVIRRSALRRASVRNSNEI